MIHADYLPPSDVRKRLADTKLAALRELVWEAHLQQQVAEALGDDAQVEAAMHEGLRAKAAIDRLLEVVRAIG